ncbi:NAD(P)H-binding protein [Flammeovirga yaeyamensis]|uniref:NAD(P)H-binding protein n=1 Tax=Flammeovirga yaeyamensis TaxID=367791 RepID=A0AAX1NDN4_9BACT|nr:NAD(P)H-binding protein [Flammeovirga yaeyamensis]MBB3699164.1 uncharacterized protein YbjT (DUF2867 family) [Flammeovirga yaeyamensis]NMF35572.1 NAD(P)H-binding protein [Flammeovirga yaeyamensis]QWG04430.1 NAD(P)H-binding protein [Flammeovirga yaeyamensis]
MQDNFRVVFLGATGAVGSQALKQLLSFNNVSRILSLGRRPVEIDTIPTYLEQVKIDIHQPSSYADQVHDCDIAICTLGVGESTKVSKEEFIAIDKTAVINFAKICKDNGVKHFHLLASVGTNSKSMNYYMRTKGELIDELTALNFDSLSIYQPSMILTPTNRYGIVQGIFLVVWPKLDFIFQGSARKYRGIKVDLLGKSMANNISNTRRGVEFLTYDDFIRLQK